MQGMFRANGGCGYVKKPDLLLPSSAQLFDPNRRLPVKKTLKVGRWHKFVSAATTAH